MSIISSLVQNSRWGCLIKDIHHRRNRGKQEEKEGEGMGITQHLLSQEHVSCDHLVSHKDQDEHEVNTASKNKTREYMSEEIVKLICFS